ncbi:MAG: hypothetical protein V1848_02285 [Candidatus Magasanikbacteria bacterium]
MNQTIKTILVVLGAIILSIILIGVIGIALLYFFVIKPMNIEMKLPESTPTEENTTETTTTTEQTYDHPLLSNKQEKTLDSIGVDVKSLPTEITKEQEACALEAIGEERAKAILGGESPSLGELLKLKGCL